MSSHSFKTFFGLGVVFIIGGLQALHGQEGWATWIDMLIPVLLAIEHTFSGKLG